MQTRRSFINTTLAASTTALLAATRTTASGAPQAHDKPAKRKRLSDRERPLDLNAAHRGTPVIDQRILAASGASAETLNFFTDARKIFEANRKSTFTELPELQRLCDKYGLTVSGGAMLGALKHDSAQLWVRTIRPAEVAVTVHTPQGERRFGPVFSSAETDFSAVVPLNALPSNSHLRYNLKVDGKSVPLPADASINTPPAPGQPGKFRIAFGSCFHKTGLSNRALLERMRLRGASAFITIGDCAVDDRDADIGLHRSDYLLRDMHPGWRKLAASTAVYAAWDDHDYFNNDRAGIPEGFTAADRNALRKLWRQNWNNPPYALTGDTQGTYFHTKIGSCDLIMLDTRSLRTAPGREDAYLGEVQSRWLEQELRGCTGSFVIITSGTMWSDNISNGKDSWGVWDRAGRERIFRLIEELRLPVLLLSGDRHGARVVRIPRESGHNFWEFEAASLGAHPGPGAYGHPKESQPFGVVRKSMFGECVVDTTCDEPTATINMVDPDGKEHWSRTFTRADIISRVPIPGGQT